MEDIEQMAADHPPAPRRGSRRKFARCLPNCPADAADVLNAVPSLEEAAEVLTLIPCQHDRYLRSADAASRARCLEQVPPELAAQVWKGWRPTSGPRRFATCAITADACCCPC